MRVTRYSVHEPLAALPLATGAGGGGNRCHRPPTRRSGRCIPRGESFDRVPEHQQATASGCPAYTASEQFTALPAGQLDCTGYTDRHAFVSPDRSQVIFASNRDVGSTSSDQLYLI